MLMQLVEKLLYWVVIGLGIVATAGMCAPRAPGQSLPEIQEITLNYTGPGDTRYV